MVKRVAAIVLSLGLAGAALAQPLDAPWQDTVSGQIAAFQAQFSDPAAFIASISASGYQPIVEARSFTFGKFQKVSDTLVVQEVRLVGPDQDLYRAIYQLADEPDEGWRVQAVVLQREEGVAI